MSNQAFEKIDPQAVLAQADLRQLLEADLGPPIRGRKWHCPFHDDSTPSLSLTSDGRRFKCWGCGEVGDAIDWVSKREGVGFVEACQRLDPSLLPDGRGRGRRTSKPTPPRPTPKPAPPTKPPAFEDPTWQSELDRIVREAEDRLWTRDGRPVREWFRSRGVEDVTLRRFRIGYIPEAFEATKPLEVLANDEGSRPIWLPRGALFPWSLPGAALYDDPEDAEVNPAWAGGNIRRLADDPFDPLPPDTPKLMALRGSTRGFCYPFADHLDTQGYRPALLVEGEIDAIVGEQEIGHLAFVATVGGANQAPQPSALAALARCPVWLLAFDHDGPGVEAARRWYRAAPHKSHRVALPCKDLAAFHEAGGNIREWFTGETRRLCFEG